MSSKCSNQAGSVTVRLSTARGEVVGEKRLPDRLSCSERAQAAAVVVAAWEARLRGVAAEVRPPTQPPPLAAPPRARRGGGGCTGSIASSRQRWRRAPNPGRDARRAARVGDLERRRAGGDLRGDARARGFAAGPRARRGDRRRALAGRGVGARRLAPFRRRPSSSTPCRAGARRHCTCTAGRR